VSPGLPDFGRFAEPALLILVSLASGPKHGYAIMEDIDALCGTKIGPGTLYAALPRLEHLGLIESLPAADRRRPYRLTASGATYLQVQLSNVQEFAAKGLRRLEGLPC
jgi:DNA-binding PadR family transcriptional regulator